MPTNSRLRMLGATLLVASVAGVAAATSTARTATMCGHARVPVKTLLDQATARANFKPLPGNIAHLRALPRPPHIGAATPRLEPVEFHAYAINAPLIAARRTQTHDTIAVIGRPPDTMLIVFPDTHLCSDVGLGLYGPYVHSATDGFNADCGPSIPSDHWQRLSGTAQIVGVGFFDIRHAQPVPGAAPNGLELHPVLSFWAPQCNQLLSAWPSGA